MWLRDWYVIITPPSRCGPAWPPYWYIRYWRYWPAIAGRWGVRYNVILSMAILRINSISTLHHNRLILFASYATASPDIHNGQAFIYMHAPHLAEVPNFLLYACNHHIFWAQEPLVTLFFVPMTVPFPTEQKRKHFFRQKNMLQRKVQT